MPARRTEAFLKNPPAISSRTDREHAESTRWVAEDVAKRLPDLTATLRRRNDAPLPPEGSSGSSPQGSPDDGYAEHVAELAVAWVTAERGRPAWRAARPPSEWFAGEHAALSQSAGGGAPAPLSNVGLFGGQDPRDC